MVYFSVISEFRIYENNSAGGDPVLPALIPFPKSIVMLPGVVPLYNLSAVVPAHASGYLKTLLQELTDSCIDPANNSDKVSGSVKIHFKQDLLQDFYPYPGSYVLEIHQQKIIVHSKETSGEIYALQTLKQLLYQYESELPCMKIEDWPSYEWRGFMLDVSRHFCPVPEIERILDLMVLHKMNIFHWHITDDQGWRFEVPGFPLLKEIGSKRNGTQIYGRKSKEVDGTLHEGCYSEEELRRVIQYASERGITIVPEVDLPGHVMALLAAYPEFSCTGGPFSVPERFGIFPDVLCMGNNAALDFCFKLIDYICTVFPGNYIHIGGDEVPGTRWESCPDCQALMHRERISTTSELQTWFTNSLCTHIISKGKRPVGWNEVLQEGLQKEVIGQYWMGLGGKRKKMVKELQAGRSIIFSSLFFTYLDQTYKLLPLEKAYRYNPVPKRLQSENLHILGIEAPLWTEWIEDQVHRDTAMFPRLTAYAEISWSGFRKKPLKDFIRRLESFTSLLQDKQVAIAPKSLWHSNPVKRLLSLRHVSDDTHEEMMKAEEKINKAMAKKVLHAEKRY